MAYPDQSLPAAQPTTLPSRSLGAALLALGKTPGLWLAVLMVAFTAWFTLYAVQLHDAHLTHKADLGQIDLAIWNTAHGRFVQEVVGDHVSSRLTDHVEPIFMPLSLIYWLWDDVRALLAAQALALALGAVPIYLLARRRLFVVAPGAAAGWGGLVFGAAYLLAPPLGAAAVSEFHALALAPPLIAWAFWAGERRQWLRFILAAVLLMAVQEGMALLAAMLGVYLLVREIPGWRASKDPAARIGAVVGAGTLVLGLAWFYIATFRIIPHFAALAYGLNQTPYAARYGELGDSFGDVLKSFVLRPAAIAHILGQPTRLAYLARLLAPSGFLALFAPGILALSLPLLLANLLSAFPFQYSGELHYSVPLVPYVIIAGAGGLARLGGWLGRNDARHARLVVLSGLALVLACAFVVQGLAGYLPAGGGFRAQAPVPWPPVSAHDRLLDRFVARIPAYAPASASSDLYPHLSHRPRLYHFPEVGDAEWALVDVSGTTDRHPQTIRDRVSKLLASGWGVADAADGYILLERGGGAAALPSDFYTFTRLPNSGAAHPQYPLDIRFGSSLRLLGYDLVDEARWRRTTLRTYWQLDGPPPPALSLNIQVLAPDGSVAADTALTPPPAFSWYPPEGWQAGDVVVAETLPWYLPAAWAPVISASAAGQPQAAQGCSSANSAPGLPSFDQPLCLPDGRLQLPAWHRGSDGRLAAGAPSDRAATQAGVTFAAEGWRARLSGYTLPAGTVPGGQLPLTLLWEPAGGARVPGGPAYTVFVHLRDAAGRMVANADATPTYFTPALPDGWAQGGSAPYPDAHVLNVPQGTPTGRYRLVIGWYDAAGGTRVDMLDSSGNVAGNEYVLGEVQVGPEQARVPDLACLLAPPACASQP